MTALCGGGTSGPAPGVQELITYDTGAIALALAESGNFWALAAAPLLPVIAEHAIAFCSTDPPADVPLTSAEYQALLELNPPDLFGSALSKLGNKVLNMVWHAQCVCLTVATPPLPASVMAPPANVTIVQQGNGPCFRRQWGGPVHINPTSGHIVGTDAYFDRIMFPELGSVTVGGPTTPWDPHPVSVKPTINPWPYWRMSSDLVAPADQPANVVTVLVFEIDNTGGVFQGPFQHQINAANPHQATSWLPLHSISTYPNFMAYAYQVGGTTAAEINVVLEMLCTGQTPDSQQACCTDPVVLSTLGQIWRSVELMQRQLVPFAYVHGTAHSGLTGQGEFAVQGLLGMLVQLTTIPPFVGLEAGNPLTVWQAGWINWGNADGFAAREWISGEQLLSLPNLAGQFTRLGFSLTSGVTATFTELLREP